LQVHLIYDLQLMMAGKSIQISPDEYIAASLSIFLDIINIFLMILTILGGGGCAN
jgi:FtsH-binding integral membrane protein